MEVPILFLWAWGFFRKYDQGLSVPVEPMKLWENQRANRNHSINGIHFLAYSKGQKRYPKSLCDKDFAEPLGELSGCAIASKPLFDWVGCTPKGSYGDTAF